MTVRLVPYARHLSLGEERSLVSDFRAQVVGHREHAVNPVGDVEGHLLFQLGIHHALQRDVPVFDYDVHRRHGLYRVPREHRVAVKLPHERYSYPVVIS